MIHTKDEIVVFLKERSIFRVLSEQVLSGIAPLFELSPCGPGHVVFRQGDASDAIYVILDGSVQVLDEGPPPKVLAYLTAGDSCGEVGVMQDCKRESTVRVPEEALLLKLPRKAFEELQTYFPAITRQVNDVLNRRITGNLPVSTPGLQGNLAFFDLPTVIQTVSNSRQTGVLKLSGRAGKPIATLSIRQGKIVSASFLHLTGEHAVFELLARSEPLDFVFEQQAELDRCLPADKILSSAEPYKLLLEGARRADKLPQLMRDLDWSGGIPLRSTKTPDWSCLKEESIAVAKKLWLLIEVGLSIKHLCDKLPFDRYTILTTLDEMRECGLTRGKQAGSTGSEAPASVAPIFAALNLAAANLALILGKEDLRKALCAALAQSAQRYPLLSSLKVHTDAATLDLRSALPEVSQSRASVESLEDLTITFLRLASQIKKDNRSAN